MAGIFALAWNRQFGAPPKAVSSRSKARGTAFATCHGIPVSYGSLEGPLSDPDISMVYVALPTHMHAEWVAAALRAGKHVLCEKPLAPTFAEASFLYDLAEYSGAVLLEAMPYRFTDLFQEMRASIAGGQIGSPRLVQARMTYTRRLTEADRMAPFPAADHGGGALLASGCYAIAAAEAIFDAPPKRAFGSLTPLDGIDGDFLGLIDFGEGRYAQIAASCRLAESGAVVAIGTEGRLEAPIRNTVATGDCMTVIRGSHEEIRDFGPHDGFHREAQAFEALAKSDEKGMLFRGSSLRVAAATDALFQSARLERWQIVDDRIIS